MLYAIPTQYKEIKIEDVPAGHWMALDGLKEQVVIAHDIELQEVVNAANRCGFKQPMVMRQLSYLTVNVKFEEEHKKGE